MRVGDDVVVDRVVVVVPLEGDLVAGLDVDVPGGSAVAVDVAGHGARGHIGDGVVVGGSADVAISSVAETLVDIVDEDVEDGGVAGSEGSSAQKSENGLHRVGGRMERRMERRTEVGSRIEEANVDR